MLTNTHVCLIFNFFCILCFGLLGVASLYWFSLGSFTLCIKAEKKSKVCITLL